MISLLPRGARAAARRRVDYRPPAFVVDDIALTFDLDPDATEVTSTYAFRRNPGASAVDRRAPLTLDGEQQER
jgi:aminopeptidase N